MKEKTNNKLIILLMGLIIVILIILCILFATDTISIKINKNNSVKDNITEKEVKDQQQDISNNLTVVLEKECPNNYTNGCDKTVTINNKDNQSTLYISEKELKLDDIQILKLEGESAEYLYQVSVYNDIILTLEGFSLGRTMKIYNFKGDMLKEISEFKDNNGKLFSIYSSYNENELFNVSTDGIISIVGTKHLQGAANTYIDNNGETIDLCTQGQNIAENEIVSGIFKFSYLGDYNFSDISYVSTKTTVKDIKTCS